MQALRAEAADRARLWGKVDGRSEELGSGETEVGSGAPGHEGKAVDWARRLFHNAEPSNSLAKAGLLVHCFDESEEPPGLFKPCVSGWCGSQHLDRWWSASIINSKQPNTFGDSGLLLSPAKNHVNCSFVDDVGTMRTGCATGNSTRYRNGVGKFERHELKKMLERSMNSELLLGYNEVLIDSTKFMQRLPRSIAAVIFGLKGDDAYGRVQATQTYLSILDEFGLTEKNHIRLIKVSYDKFERMYNTSSEAHWDFTDVSEGAREFLDTHPYESHRKEWLKQNPLIEKHPEMAREYLLTFYPAPRPHGCHAWQCVAEVATSATHFHRCATSATPAANTRFGLLHLADPKMLPHHK